MRLRAWWMIIAVASVAAGCGSDGVSGTPDAAEQDTLVLETDTEIIITYDTFVAPDAADVVPVDTYEPPKPGEFGYTCAGNADCNSGWCIQTASGRKCTRTCVEECPELYDCREAPGTDATYICVPKFTHLCDPCDETADCNEPGQTGNYCLSYGPNGKFCGGECNNDANCPGGYVCRLVPVGGGGQARQCVPPDGGQCRCSDLAKSLQLSTTCYVENDHGKCNGQRFCTQGGLNSCDAAEPYPESCNGADDNCNGIPDDFPPDYQCFIENEFGTCKGKGTCSEGAETCVGEAPKPEQCNGIDDDCDGETDEGLCNDQNPCTHDFCDSDGNCAHTPDNTLLCDDGNVCTQVDKCEDNICKGFNPLPCGDGNPCFEYKCDAVAGCLTNYANGAACEDGQPCTINDKCNLGVCVGGSWDSCDDGNPCTNNSCVAGQGCTKTNVTNGVTCGGGLDDQCVVGQCVNGACSGIAANEGGGCTPPSPVNSCQRGVCHNKICAIESQPNGTGCTVGSHPQCSQGTCAGSTCVPLSGMTCNDNDKCTNNDRCSGGQCAGEERDCNAELTGQGYFCLGIAPCVEIFGTATCLPIGVCF